MSGTYDPEEIYKITRCRDCPNAVINMASVEEAIKNIFQVAIAGCPNSCSQPQIKDFGLQGQVIPEHPRDGGGMLGLRFMCSSLSG